MKKYGKVLTVIVTLAAIAAMALFAACGGNNNNDRTAKTAEPGNSSAPSDPTAAPQNGDDGFVIKKGDVVIALNKPAAPVVSALGEPTSYYEEASCAFEGMDKTYSYPDFDLKTYTLDGVDYVNAVIFWTDNVETSEGLYIGASAAAVEKAYPGAAAQGQTSVKLEKGGSRLLILLKNDVVTSIQYLAITE